MFGLEFGQLSGLSYGRVVYFYLHGALPVCIVQKHEQLFGLIFGWLCAAFRVAEVNIGLVIAEDIGLPAPSKCGMLLPQVEQGAQLAKDLLFVVSPAFGGEGADPLQARRGHGDRRRDIRPDQGQGTEEGLRKAQGEGEGLRLPVLPSRLRQGDVHDDE